MRAAILPVGAAAEKFVDAGEAEKQPVDSRSNSGWTASLTRHHHAGYSSPDPWVVAHGLHVKSFVNLVSRKSPTSHTIDQLLRRGPDEDDLGYSVSIAEQQRMHMRVLQVSLVDIGVTLQLDGEKMRAEDINGHGKKLERLLRDYTQAVQDYEYMTKGFHEPFDFFIASPERHHDRKVLQDMLEGRTLSDLAHQPTGDSSGGNENRLPFDAMKRAAIPTGPWEGAYRPNPLGGERIRMAKDVLRRKLWWKSSSAIVGGAFLVVPMWLLVLKRDLYVHLGAATGFVFGFGFLMVWYVDTLDQVFAATLAYAAVLMVFVGVMLDKQFPNE